MKLVVCTWVFASLALVSGGCHRGPDTEGSVRKALDQANMQHVAVKVDDDVHIVHLRGTVSSMADRSRAQEVADAVVGTSGRVLNELTIKGLNDKTAGALDDDIKDNLDDMIDNDPALKQRDINFEVVNGMVTVKGEVRTADEKNRVGDMTKAAPGVKDVANGLEIVPAQ
ncbi:MAG TPA: BON domain-containing protein [Vicinamibacterales bacterium]|jgi:hyperosmotically inducible periplasmic protein|nr:BON domain-containing protein [Vicinamibacterales bacterium]